jgi:hypothetical protein
MRGRKTIEADDQPIDAICFDGRFDPAASIAMATLLLSSLRACRKIHRVRSVVVAGSTLRKSH